MNLPRCPSCRHVCSERIESMMYYCHTPGCGWEGRVEDRPPIDAVAGRLAPYRRFRRTTLEPTTLEIIMAKDELLRLLAHLLDNRPE